MRVEMSRIHFSISLELLQKLRRAGADSHSVGLRAENLLTDSQMATVTSPCCIMLYLFLGKASFCFFPTSFWWLISLFLGMKYQLLGA